MIFELTESPWYCQCENLFTTVYYDSKYENCLGIDLSKSRLPNIQAFLQNVLERELISHIIFELETCFALPEEFICFNIEADQFCDTVNDAYKNKKSMMMPPVIRINISKESRQTNEPR